MTDEMRQYEMLEKTRDGDVRPVSVTVTELATLLMTTAGEIAGRSRIVTCQLCGRRFLVNNQDFHLKKRCNKGFGCMQ